MVKPAEAKATGKSMRCQPLLLLVLHNALVSSGPRKRECVLDLDDRLRHAKSSPVVAGTDRRRDKKPTQRGADVFLARFDVIC